MFLVTIFYFSQVTNLQIHPVSNLQIHAASPYCLFPCSAIVNTMCEYQQAGGPPMCSSFISGLSTKQRQLVLDRHNRLRQLVALGMVPNQPSAANMMALTWDDEAERIAERWAEQCQKSAVKESKDGCRTKLNGEEGGQNISVDMPELRYKNITSLLSSRITQWFVQGEVFQFEWMAKYTYSKDTESFSQIVWADTDQIGCGLSYNDSVEYSMYRFVCNYYPTGNTEGEMIYKKGLACSECPEGSGCSKRWPGLCTTVAEDKGGKVPPDAINTDASANVIHSSSIIIIFGLNVYVYFCYLKVLN